MPKNKITLFTYQERVVQDCLDYLHGPSKKPGLVTVPTAGGKSLIISATAKRYGKPCLVLQPNAELLQQNLGKLLDMGETAEVYSASLSTKNLGYMTYATLGSIKDLAHKFKALGVETVFIDEADRQYPPDPGSMFMKFIEELKPKKVIGFTATPFRLKTNMEGSQLKMLNRIKPGYFKEMIHVIQVQDIINENRWAKLVYEYYDFDESLLELNSSQAEFTEQSMKQAIEVQGINNNIFVRIKKLAKGGKKGILVFMDTLDNAKKMSDTLNERGVCNSACLTSFTPKKERAKIVKDFKSGKIKVVTNYNILSVGFDYPELDVVILGTPTNSLSMYYQRLGRGTRVHPEKENCLIVDFCNNLKRFGKIENLTVEDVPGFGWGVFNGDVALTNVPMGSFKVTKSDLLNKSGNVNIMTMWFGKFKGQAINRLPISYVKWALNSWDFQTANMKVLKKEFVSMLEQDAVKFVI